MRSFTVDERRARLARRHHLSDGLSAASVEALTGTLVGLHATDPATPYLSVRARVADVTVSDISAALYEQRSVVKHLAMRRTLWVVRPQDLPLIQSAASERVAANETRRLAADAQGAGVASDGHAWLEAACSAVIAHLGQAGPCSAKQLRETLPELTGTWDPAPGKSWGGEGHLAPRVLTVLSARGHIVRGPNDGTWTTSRPRWVAAADWLTSSAAVAPEAAAAELVRRWLYAFGPATVTDIKWWFGNTLGWTRQALNDIDAVEVDVHGTPGWALADDLEPEPAVTPWCALLPGLDVTTMGWFDRDWYLGPHRGQVFDRNGNAGPTAWADGRVVGAWRQDGDGQVELALLEDVSRRTRTALSRKAKELTAWLGGVRVNPRFPSPASKGR